MKIADKNIAEYESEGAHNPKWIRLCPAIIRWNNMEAGHE